MPDDLTAEEVQQYVTHLFEDQDLRRLHDLARERHKLHSMLKVPELPDHFSRGGGTSEPTPMLIWLSDNILASTMAYPTMITVSPLGDQTQEQQKQADKHEKWASVFRHRADDGKSNTREVRWHLLLSPYAILSLRCGDPKEEFPWTVETPDPLTCAFIPERPPFRPKMFARRYKKLVWDIEDDYSNRRTYRKGKWVDGGNWRLVNGKWTDETLSEDYAYENNERPQHSAGGPFREVTVYELHKDDMIYHLAMNDGTAEGDMAGQVVWQGKSMTGGVGAVVISGSSSPLREATERLRPFLWPVYQMVLLINNVRAKRATRSENAKPDVVVGQTPEEYNAQNAVPGVGNVNAANLEAGKPNFINVIGKPTMWALQDDPDLDKQEQSYWTELNKYINAITEVSEPENLDYVGVTSFLTNIESRKRQFGPMLFGLDWGWKQIIKMAITSIAEYDRDFPLFATANDLHKEVKMGMELTIGPSDIKDFDKHFWLEVETKSTTEQEARLRIQDWAYRKQLKLSTQLEGISAANYTDEMAQVEALVVDQGLEMIGPWIAQEVQASVEEEIRLTSGIMLGLGTAPGPPQASGGLPSGTSTGAPPMQPGAVPGAVGGSGAPP